MNYLLQTETLAILPGTFTNIKERRFQIVMNSFNKINVKQQERVEKAVDLYVHDNSLHAVITTSKGF